MRHWPEPLPLLVAALIRWCLGQEPWSRSPLGIASDPPIVRGVCKSTDCFQVATREKSKVSRPRSTKRHIATEAVILVRTGTELHTLHPTDTRSGFHQSLKKVLVSKALQADSRLMGSAQAQETCDRSNRKAEQALRPSADCPTLKQLSSGATACYQRCSDGMSLIFWAPSNVQSVDSPERAVGCCSSAL